ncbi:TRAP transporter small permease subunit [Sulfitobacter sp. JBTF-M27]|uniref:TRAP transporter small permease protein n=1 Tax=Sulfitobacter sediminilitoris TaxID=2698830 RepID=A0A6P0CAF9_9RHOB|nr:TRAP transporter small permease subunit [Sulfitobacter sediminilitoris]NEK23209.1 TRAP transporter small permease subunit [Sulfitobacter sediminilitoris]
MTRYLKWLPRLAEILAGALLAAIFATFLLQIGSRYLPKVISGLGLSDTLPMLASVEPLGWTLELIGILWVWVIFFSCAFVVREHEHVKFDIIYLAVPTKIRRIFALVSAAAIVAGMLYALLPTWDYIDFMRVRRTATVTNPLSGNKIQLRTIFLIYAIFLVAVAARYGWQLWNVWRNGPPKTELEVALEAADAKDRP